MEELKQEASNYLRDETQLLSWLFAKLESLTSVQREHLAAFVAIVYSFYLVFGYFAQLLCNFTGFAYPAYASMIAIETVEKSDDTQWLIYWTVYAVFCLVDGASDAICGYFPIYWLVKCVFLVYLYHPLTKGANVIYENLVRSVLQEGGVIVGEAVAAMSPSFREHLPPANAAEAPPTP